MYARPRIRRIYLASSWKHPHHQEYVQRLRSWGHLVYDFRHGPAPGISGFSWKELDSGRPEDWSPEELVWLLLSHPRAAQGYLHDMRALEQCDTCVLLQPCGRSAHLEFGWACGRGKHTVAYIDGHADLMLLMASTLVTTDEELRRALI